MTFDLGVLRFSLAIVLVFCWINE